MELTQDATQSSFMDLELANPSGKRRWPYGKNKDDMTYYTFEDIAAYLNGVEGIDNSRAAALDFWEQCVDQESEHALIRKMVDDVRSFEVWQGWRSNRYALLELRDRGELKIPGTEGCCLRLACDGNADTWGGVCPQSLIGIETLPTSPDCLTWQVLLKAHTGGCLRKTGSVLDFRGIGNEDNVIFELLPRDGGFWNLALKGEQPLCSFVLRKAPDWLTEAPHACGIGLVGPPPHAVVEAAKAALQTDKELQGRRRHLQDPTWSYYTFEEMLLYVQHLYGLDIDAAMSLARPMWMQACVSESPDEAWVYVGQTGADDDEDMMPAV